jgi:hypothetical protein
MEIGSKEHCIQLLTDHNPGPGFDDDFFKKLALVIHDRLRLNSRCQEIMDEAFNKVDEHFTREDVIEEYLDKTAYLDPFDDENHQWPCFRDAASLEAALQETFGQ